MIEWVRRDGDRMNREEFLSLRQNLLDVVIEYEVLQRKAYFIENSYILEFYVDLEQQRYVQHENDYMIKAIALHAEGKSDSEVQTFLNTCKVEFQGIMNSFQRRYTMAKELEQRCKNYDSEDIINLDRDFITYCSKYHPLVKAHSSEAEHDLYDLLISMYRIGNIQGFKSVLEENISILKEDVIKEEEMDKLASLYQESLQQLKGVLEKQKNSFPLSKEYLFTDSMNLAKESVRLREENAGDREINKTLQKDFKENFSFPFEL